MLLGSTVNLRSSLMSTLVPQYSGDSQIGESWPNEAGLGRAKRPERTRRSPLLVFKTVTGSIAL